jgi:hypothetical protein
MSKDDMREQLNKEVERFLRSGKKIQELPPAPEEATLPGGMCWWTVDDLEAKEESEEDYG